MHLLIPTHTTRHLDTCLASLVRQEVPPAWIAISCDTDDAAIGRLLDGLWPRIVARLRDRGISSPPRLVHTFRPYQGQPRPSQVRNNGLRALEQVAGLGDADLVVGIDGDMILAPDALQRHATLAARGFEVVIPFRVCLDEATTAGLSADAFLGDSPPDLALAPADLASLDARQRRYARQLRVQADWPRWLAGVLIKPHKPKIISAHYAVTAGRLRAINGYDEEFVEYGYEDDDLARRLHALRPPPRVAIGVRDILAFHLWHPSRAPARPTQAPGYARFRRRPVPTAAGQGWRNPVPQPTPMVRIVADR